MFGGKFDDGVRLFELYRGYIEHEDALVDARTTWFIQLHSFLIASYGLIFAAVVTTFSEDFDTVKARLGLQVVSGLLLLAITLIGFGSSRAAHLSVKAAGIAVSELKARGNAAIAAYDSDSILPPLTGGGSPEADRLGAELSGILPRGLMVLWAFSTGIPLALVAIGWSAKA